MDRSLTFPACPARRKEFPAELFYFGLPFAALFVCRLIGWQVLTVSNPLIYCFVAVLSKSYLSVCYHPNPDQDYEYEKWQDTTYLFDRRLLASSLVAPTGAALALCLMNGQNADWLPSLIWGAVALAMAIGLVVESVRVHWTYLGVWSVTIVSLGLSVGYAFMWRATSM